MTGRPAIRAAIYTRKSTEDGLDQEFNSLDAQYEACAAYIASQRHEGWSLVRERFDDGGVSGGTLDRPGLQRLMAEVDAGRIGMIVVYKIDRLTRSLADFARLVDRLDAAKASFVSVTQAFNTSTSMGRLTLNVLLSFAQFEREVTAERIRDKIAASKRKGLWMGGTVPLGYRLSGDQGARSIICDEEEAAMVRQVFDLYDELGNIRLVEERAGELGLRTRAQVLPSGLIRGGRPFTRGQIHYLLTNPTYRGLIRHKDRTYPGSHPPIISEDQWARVQKALLAARARPRRGPDNVVSDGSVPLLGKLVDETGERLTSSETSARGKSYRYYVSNRLLHGAVDATGWRLPAKALEEFLATHIATQLVRLAERHGVLTVPDARQGAEIVESANRIAERLNKGGCGLLGPLIQRCLITAGNISIEIDRIALGHALNIPADTIAPEVLKLSVPFSLRRRGIETRIIAGPRELLPDMTLLRALAASHRLAAARLRGASPGGLIMTKERASGSRERRKAWLAFLSPHIQMAILEGHQPEGFSLERILQSDMPLAWHEQERMFGFAEKASED